MTPAPRTAPLRLAALALLALSLVLSACSSDAEPQKQTKAADTPSPSATTSTPPPPPEPSRLSGRMGKPNGPVYAVKIDNTGKAHPQAGLSKADVVYVEQVEGGVTRLAAIYSSVYPKYVGPVRSGRITDIELLKQYGTVGLFYSGSQNKLADNLQRADLKLVSFDQDHTGYTRSRCAAPAVRRDRHVRAAAQAGRQGRLAARDGLHLRRGARPAARRPRPSR